MNPKHRLPPSTRRHALPVCGKARVAPEGLSHVCLTCRNPVNWVPCVPCEGIGAEMGVICPTCNGHGGQWIHRKASLRALVPPTPRFGSGRVS